MRIVEMCKRLRERYLWFEVNHRFPGPGNFERKRKNLIKLGFEIGEGTRVAGPIRSTAKLKIGKNCWIGKDFKANGYGTVYIGDNCDIAPGVSFQTGSHIIGDSTRRAGEVTEKDVTVGSGTWICADSTLLGGVNVGSGCIVAACSLVNKDVDDNTMVGGVPAKIIRRLE